jgi:hypothetical protein
VGFFLEGDMTNTSTSAALAYRVQPELEPADVWPELVSDDKALRTPRSEALYLKRALANPFNVTVAVTLGSVFLLTKNLWLFLGLLVLEGFLMAFVASSRLFRKAVDRGLQVDDEQNINRERDLLLGLMSIEHQESVRSMEVMARRIRNEAQRQRSALCSALGAGLGVERLIATYARLAIALKRTQEHLALAHRADTRFDSFPRAATRLDDRRQLQWLREQQGEIRRRRAEVARRTHERMSVIEQQLAAIRELVALIYERSMGNLDSHAVDDAIRHMMDDVASHDGSIAELNEFGVEENVEPPERSEKPRREAAPVC